MDWIANRIKKGNQTHIVAFCSICTTRDPWTIHHQMEYMFLQINSTNKQEPLTQEEETQDLGRMAEAPPKSPILQG
jgi:hypothetical protein